MLAVSAAGDAVDATGGAWLADRLHPPSHRRVLAVDGKRLRGSARAGHQVHLLAALDHHDVPADTNEIALFGPLLAGLDLAGVVVTADALHTQRDHASFLIARGADYLLVVKASQPALHAQLAGLPGRQIPVMDRTREHAHGRIEVRTLKVAAVAGLCFPHAAQAIRVIRRVRAPGSLPRVMASLRNLAIGALRLAGHPNLAAALRQTGRDPARPHTILSLAHP